MKSQRTSSLKSGFTLMELMVAMAITTIIVTVLVSVTSIAMDTWNRSRAELRAARQAKAMVDGMVRDFEALVVRRGNAFEWLSAVTPADPPGVKLKSSNAAELIFFSGSTDRYNGEIGTPKDLGGDVSTVAYRLNYKDPIVQGGTTFTTFVLNRLLVDPKPTFDSLLGKTDLSAAFKAGVFSNDLDKVENFVCENVYQFSVTFHVAATKAAVGTNPAVVVNVPVTVGQTSSAVVTKNLKMKGTGIEASITSASVTPDELKAGRISAVEISLSVLSDAGIDQLRNRTFKDEADKKAFITKHAYQYTKLVQVPSM